MNNTEKSNNYDETGRSNQLKSSHLLGHKGTKYRRIYTIFESNYHTK